MARTSRSPSVVVAATDTSRAYENRKTIVPDQDSTSISSANIGAWTPSMCHS